MYYTSNPPNYQQHTKHTLKVSSPLLSFFLLTETMKQNFHSWGLLFFLLFLITFSQTSAATRFLTTKNGKNVVQISDIDNEGYEEKDSLNELMGTENCGNGDEECLKRRAIAEAHLDYIYTQHRKP